MTVRGRKVKGRGSWKSEFYCFSSLSICANFSILILLEFYLKALEKIKIFEKHKGKDTLLDRVLQMLKLVEQMDQESTQKTRFLLTHPPPPPTPTISLLATYLMTVSSFPILYISTFPFLDATAQIGASTRGLPINAFIRFHMKICFKKLLLIYLLSCQSIHSRGRFTNNY